MSKIFLIAGLGADTRVYNNIDLTGYEVIPVDWIEPHQTDTLKTYAQRLIHQYDIRPGSIIIGNSLGGMIGVEIANTIPIKKLILISSIKTVDEIPWHFYFFRAVPVYKIIRIKWFASMGFLVRFAFGKMNAADQWLFHDMVKNSSPVFMKWAMGAMIKWDNKTVPANVVQISGDKDLVLSYKVKDAIIIKGGSHVMIFDKSKEINKILKRILKK
jgi:pimeloyl-ACP methyl ester carboxylesterase